MKKVLDLRAEMFYKQFRNDRGIAQLVEHWSPKPSVERSNRSAPAKSNKPPVWAVLVFLSRAVDLRQKINIC